MESTQPYFPDGHNKSQRHLSPTNQPWTGLRLIFCLSLPQVLRNLGLLLNQSLKPKCVPGLTPLQVGWWVGRVYRSPSLFYPMITSLTITSTKAGISVFLSS